MTGLKADKNRSYITKLSDCDAFKGQRQREQRKLKSVHFEAITFVSPSFNETERFLVLEEKSQESLTDCGQKQMKLRGVGAFNHFVFPCDAHTGETFVGRNSLSHKF